MRLMPALLHLSEVLKYVEYSACVVLGSVVLTSVTLAEGSAMLMYYLAYSNAHNVNEICLLLLVLLYSSK